MFPYCCLLIICIMFFHVQFSRYIWAIRSMKSPVGNFIQRTTYSLFSITSYLEKWWAKVDSIFWWIILGFASCNRSDRTSFVVDVPFVHFHCVKMVGQSGLEPPTSRLSVVCSSQLSYWPIWWRLAGSNRWPPACKAGALPAELNPHISTSH